MPREHLTGALIIGAGPAGLMAADVLTQAGWPVALFDASASPARKFLMAGVGGLNITHAEDFELFLTRYAPAAPQLISALRAFPPSKTRDFCSELGQETFVGASGRVFPKTMKASPLLRAWLRRLERHGARLRLRVKMVDWTAAGFAFQTPDGVFNVSADAAILALGGASWPRFGARGDWGGLALARGLTVAPFEASNCGVLMDWPVDFSNRFEGAPLKNLRLSCGEVCARGEIVVTRTGLEGGPIYALSHVVRRALKEGGDAVLTIDFKPDLDAQALAARLAKGRKGDSLSNLLRKAGLSPAHIGLLRQSEGGPLQRAPESLARRVKAARLRILGQAGLERAISSAGGVRFASLDADFMAISAPGVFLAGEMLDWDAPTGGYLLQACLATGAAAGRGAAQWLERQKFEPPPEPPPIKPSRI